MGLLFSVATGVSMFRRPLVGGSGMIRAAHGILGGTGTILGPFLGAAIILGIRNWVSGYVVWWTSVMGLVFIATVLWAPDGIVGLVNRLRAARARRKAS